MFIVKKDGAIWHYRAEQGWVKVYSDAVVSAAMAHRQLYVLRPDGRVVVVAP
ncbi:MAG: hypothetical protein IPJ65_11235 [Archangiaceae bacterium]|nr:hypothetical protein [Archangiaceae bacterium]